MATVQDDGIGFDTEAALMNRKKHLGFGLFNVRERLKALGGGMAVASEADCGSLVRMWVPYKPPESTNREDAQ